MPSASSPEYSFGPALAAVRGGTQPELAGLLGFDRALISVFEQGTRRPSQIIAVAMGLLIKKAYKKEWNKSGKGYGKEIKKLDETSPLTDVQRLKILRAAARVQGFDLTNKMILKEFKSLNLKAPELPAEKTASAKNPLPPKKGTPTLKVVGGKDHKPETSPAGPKKAPAAKKASKAKIEKPLASAKPAAAAKTPEVEKPAFDPAARLEMLKAASRIQGKKDAKPTTKKFPQMPAASEPRITWFTTTTPDLEVSRLSLENIRSAVESMRRNRHFFEPEELEVAMRGKKADEKVIRNYMALEARNEPLRRLGDIYAVMNEVCNVLRPAEFGPEVTELRRIFNRAMGTASAYSPKLGG
jgi:hypothetical protein